MRPFEVDDISPIDMERVQQLTADFMKAENGGRTGAEQQLAQELHCVLKPYNKFSSSLLLKVRANPPPLRYHRLPRPHPPHHSRRTCTGWLAEGGDHDGLPRLRILPRMQPHVPV